VEIEKIKSDLEPHGRSSSMQKLIIVKFFSRELLQPQHGSVPKFYADPVIVNHGEPGESPVSSQQPRASPIQPDSTSLNHVDRRVVSSSRNI
jgi:hypothetical protein